MKKTARREEALNVQIRVSVRERLREYVESQYPRPVMSDVVSLAVSEYLDKAEREAVGAK